MLPTTLTATVRKIPQPEIKESPARFAVNSFTNTRMVYGFYKKFVKAGIWMNIAFIAIRVYGNPFTALKRMRNLSRLRDNFRNGNSIIKYARVNGRYYYSYTAPGWPSPAFNNYIRSNLTLLSEKSSGKGLQTVVFAITKKCSYACEHCFEWDALNKKETLSRETIVELVQSFQQAGISNIILSGGEPLNRFDDILFLLKQIKPAAEVWLFTSGYQLSRERARMLKLAGLNGISVSLEFTRSEEQDRFRGRQGAYDWAATAVENARREGLVACLSLCATNEFISRDNLYAYAQLAKDWGISFIQLIEPKAVGHFAGKDVFLPEEKRQLLEEFYLEMNYNKRFRDYPSVVYHEYYSRRVGCAGGGNHYLYVDTDGDVHNCSFCQKKLFSALNGPLQENIATMRRSGCSMFTKSD